MRRACELSPLLLLALCLGVLPACRAAAPDARPRVAVSVEPQRELVERLAGGAVEVVAMIAANSDVESYSPSPQQMAALA